MNTFTPIFKILALGALLNLSLLFSQAATKVASSSGQFLKIGVGARAAGMGDTFSAIASDATAIYWNPGGLSRLTRNQVFAGYTNWLADINLSFFAVSVQAGRSGTMGLFATALQVPEDEVRTVLQPEGTGEYFEAGDVAIGLAYARGITDKFSAGIVGKLVQETIWSMKANALAVDIGTLYNSGWNGLRIGIVLNNFGTKTKLSGRANLMYVDPDPVIEGNIEQIRAELEMGRWDLPLNLKTSVSMVPVNTPALQLTTAVDMIHPNDNREYINLGGELGIMKMLFLRGGYRGYGMDAAEGGVTFGGGLRFPLSGVMTLQIDYALADYGRLKNVSQISTAIEF